VCLILVVLIFADQPFHFGGEKVADQSWDFVQVFVVVHDAEVDCARDHVQVVLLEQIVRVVDGSR